MIASEEIKTLHLGVNEVRDQDILCNLDSLGDDVRSLFGQTLLLSARPLSPRPSSSARPTSASRCSVRRPPDLPVFPERLRRWMSGA